MQPVDYTDVAHTGPGTLAGRYLRRFWQPVYLARDLLPGHAKPVRIMSEDFTLYRGEGGTAHAVAFRCAHRGTQLSTGWVEGDSIRCFYHGWKYDGSGQCVEQPAEEASFAQKVWIRSYPTEEYLGLIFVYLGEGDAPSAPHYSEFDLPGLLDASTYTRPCNYFNELEIDPVHVAFVHRDSPEAEAGLAGIPSVACEETEYGYIQYVSYPGHPEARVTHRLMPNISFFKVYPPNAQSAWRDRMAWRVPIDDERCASFAVDLEQVAGAVDQRFRERPAAPPEQPKPTISELAGAVLAGEVRVADVQDQVDAVRLQDEIALRGVGTIADRRHDDLGRSDVGVILFRKLWARELQALANGQPLRQWTQTHRLVVASGV